MNKKKISLMVALVATIGTMEVAQAELHDRGGGLIYDDVLDVTWLQNVNYGAGSIYDNENFTRKAGDTTDGRMDWFNAMDWAANLTYYDSVRDVVWSDWRLPEIKCWVNGEYFNRDRRSDGTSDVGLNITSPCNELAYMYYVNLDNIGRKDIYGNIQPGQGMVDDPLNPNDESLFIGIDINSYQNYWYSNIRPDNASNAFDFRADNGNVAAGNWHYDRLAWAVRDGDVATDTAAPLPPREPTDPNIAIAQITTTILIPSLDSETDNTNIWANFVYYGMTAAGEVLLRLQDRGENLPAINDANTGTISETLIHIPSVNYQSLFNNLNIWMDLTYYGLGPNGEKLWALDNYGQN